MTREEYVQDLKAQRLRILIQRAAVPDHMVLKSRKSKLRLSSCFHPSTPMEKIDVA